MHRIKDNIATEQRNHSKFKDNFHAKNEVMLDRGQKLIKF